MDKETREVIRELATEVTRLSTEVTRLSTLMSSNLERDSDRESRLRKVEKWMYGIPVSYVLVLVTFLTAITRTTGKQ